MSVPTSAMERAGQRITVDYPVEVVAPPRGGRLPIRPAPADPDEGGLVPVTASAATRFDQYVRDREGQFARQPGTGYTGPSFEMPEAITMEQADRLRASVRAQANPDRKSPDLNSDEGYLEQRRITKEFDEALQPFYGIPGGDAVQLRVRQEGVILAALDKWRRDNNLAMSDREAFKALRDKTREAFAGKKIGVRVTPTELGKILDVGRFQTQFETNRSKGLKDPFKRARMEAAWFGIAQELGEAQRVLHEEEKRPVYGYVMLDGARPVGIGSKNMFAPATDALSQCGQIQVVLKPDVRERTTAMFGDSLNNQHNGMPSPVNQPAWQSYSPAWQTMATPGLHGPDRDPESQEFRAGQYAEAQIHGGVTVADIDEVILPSPPSAALRKQLDDAGVTWRVLNFKTAADSPDPDERRTALRIAEQDVRAIAAEVADTEAKIPVYRDKGDSYTVDQLTKELKTLQGQLKKIRDALPALRNSVEGDAT